METSAKLGIGFGSAILICLSLFLVYKAKNCLTYNSSDTDGDEPQGQKFTFMALFKLPQYNAESRRKMALNKETAEPLSMDANINSQNHELRSITIVEQKEESLSYAKSSQTVQHRNITRESIDNGPPICTAYNCFF